MVAALSLAARCLAFGLALGLVGLATFVRDASSTCSVPIAIRVKYKNEILDH